MLITCFQCRQQLDVPEDSAGKRVRCPHCEYVIVVLAAARSAVENADMPATAMPSLELDEETRSPAATKIYPQPLPPIVAPVPMPAPEKATSKPASAEDLPPLPPIDRPKRKRVPMSPIAKSGLPWGRILIIGGVLGVVVIAVIVMVAASQSNQRMRHRPPIAFQPMPQPMPPPNMMPPMGNQGFGNPPMQVFLPAWKDFQSAEHRFQTQFPGAPVQHQENFNQAPMTVFEVRNGDWLFAVRHRTIAGPQLNLAQQQAAFAAAEAHILNAFLARRVREQQIILAGGHPGREWDFSLPNGRQQFARTYLVWDGQVQHQYLLIAHGPFNVFRHHADIGRFFESFRWLGRSHGQSIFEDMDDVPNGGRRDNEIMTLALHPNKAVFVTASRDDRVVMAESLKKLPWSSFVPSPGKPAQQLAFSRDGALLAIADGEQIRVWRNWENLFERFAPGQAQPGGELQSVVLSGSRCVFTQNNLVLASLFNKVVQYDPLDGKILASLDIPKLTIKGLALAKDQDTLALFGGQTIELWSWKAKKLLGRIDAHALPITTLAFTPDGTTLASASADRAIKIWDVKTLANRATLKQHAWAPWSLAFTPDGKHLVSGGLDGMLILWDLQANPPRPAWAQAHQFPIRAVALDAEGKNCLFAAKQASNAGQGVARRYTRAIHKIALADMKPNPAEAERTIAQQAGLHLPASSVMSYFAPQGRTFVTTTDGIDNFSLTNSLRAWDTATASLQQAHTLKNYGVLSPDGKWFVLSKPGFDRRLQLLHLASKGRFDFDTPAIWPQNAFPLILFAPDSKSFWVQSQSQFIHHEIQTPAQGDVRVILQRPVDLKPINDPSTLQIYPSLDNKSFLVERRSNDGVVRSRTLFDGADGKALPFPKVEPDRRPNFVRLRQLSNQVELQDLLHGTNQVIGQQRGFLQQQAIDPQGKFAVTSVTGLNQTMRIHLWDLQERRPVLALNDQRTRSLTAIRFAPDGSHLALVSADGWTRILPMDWLMERKNLLRPDPNEATVR